MTNRPGKHDSSDPWTALASAVVLQAARDAKAGDHEAVAWLQGEGLRYLEFIGIDLEPEFLRGWINSGMPGIKPSPKPWKRPAAKKAADFPAKVTNGRAINDPGRPRGQRAVVLMV